MYLLWNNTQTLSVLDSYAWSLTLRAIPFASRPSTTQRSTISFEHLEALVRACVDSSTCPLKVALVFGFMGYLRVSNLAPATLNEFDHLRHTTWGDVTESEEGIMLHLKWTKTRQAESEAAPIPLPALGESEVCPLTIWREYVNQLKPFPVGPNSPLLLSTDEPKGRIITISRLRALLRRAAEAAGLSHLGFTPHSLRRGGASHSFLEGVPIENIKHHGTWQSDAVNRYLQATPRFTTPVAKAFASSLGSPKSSR